MSASFDPPDISSWSSVVAPPARGLRQYRSEGLHELSAVDPYLATEPATFLAP